MLEGKRGNRTREDTKKNPQLWSAAAKQDAEAQNVLSNPYIYQALHSLPLKCYTLILRLRSRGVRGGVKGHHIRYHLMQSGRCT